MALGLSEQELRSLISYGETVDEMVDNIFGVDRHDTMAVGAHMFAVLTLKIAEVVNANNKRIEEQLKSAGINLPV